MAAIGGDWSAEALEAFRNAYANQMATPEDDAVANMSGMPTDTVANVSPWYGHIENWKYPSGKGPDEDLKRTFDPSDYLSDPDEEDEDEEMDIDDDLMEEARRYLDSVLEEEGGEAEEELTEEEIDALVAELLNAVDDEEE